MANLTDREKLVDIVCNAMQKDYCVCHCNYPPCKPVKQIVDDLITHGLTVRQMQKPLTVLDIHEMAKEKPGHGWPFDDVPPVLCAEMRNGRMLWVTWGTVVDSVVLDNVAWVDKYNYNKEWRCWARKPTEEERQAAKWEK